MTCHDYRPDHNGECLNCDEPADDHDLSGVVCFPSPCCGVDSIIVQSTPSAVVVRCTQCGQDWKP